MTNEIFCDNNLSPPVTGHIRRVRTVGKGLFSGAGGPVNDTVVRSAENTAEYAVFALVPIFCVTGLLGIMICNLLKKKGCRCNAEKDGLDAEAATPNREGERWLDKKSTHFLPFKVNPLDTHWAEISYKYAYVSLRITNSEFHFFLLHAIEMQVIQTVHSLKAMKQLLSGAVWTLDVFYTRCCF